MKKALVFSALGLLLVVLVVGAIIYAREYGLWGYGRGPGMRGGNGGGYGGANQGPQGGYGMGPGQGGGWANQSEECQKFLDDTKAIRKELHNKRYEYSEAIRNSKTTPEMVGKMDEEISDLQQKIYSSAPPACR